MFYRNSIIYKLLPVVMALFVVLAFFPVFTEDTYAKTTTVDASVDSLYANDSISQSALTKKQKKDNLRLVNVSWSAAGSTKATSYKIYGTWQSTKTINVKKIVTKKVPYKVTKKIKIKVKKRVKYKKKYTKDGITYYKTKYKTKYVTKYKKKKVTKYKKKVKVVTKRETVPTSIHEKMATVSKTSVTLAFPNKELSITVVPVTKKGNGKASSVNLFEYTQNATQITFLNMPSQLTERTNTQITSTSNCEKDSNVTYSVSNNKFAFVSPTGLITTRPTTKPVKFTLYAYAHNGLKKKKKITVIPMYPQTITIEGKSSVSLQKGKTMTLKATASTASDSSISWSTSSKKIATVSSKGKITAVATGTVTITAKGGAFSGNTPAKDTVKLTVSPTTEAMVVWAKKIANKKTFGYSMGTTRGRGLDRFCYYCHGKKVSKDYDCASFVAAAIAHGMKDPKMLAYCKVSGGCTTLYNTLKKNGWKDMGKLSMSKLKRGDILINPSAHVEIYTGEKNSWGQVLNVGAHDNYDGRTGDSSGREISIAPTVYFTTPWHHYTHVMRYNK